MVPSRVFGNIESSFVNDTLSTINSIEGKIPKLVSDNLNYPPKEINDCESVFTARIIEIMKKYPEQFPQSLNAETLSKSFELFNDSYKIGNALEKLLWKIWNLNTKSGRETFNCAREALKIIKNSPLNEELGSEIEELEKEFPIRTKTHR